MYLNISLFHPDFLLSIEKGIPSPPHSRADRFEAEKDQQTSDHRHNHRYCSRLLLRHRSSSTEATLDHAAPNWISKLLPSKHPVILTFRLLFLFFLILSLHCLILPFLFLISFAHFVFFSSSCSSRPSFLLLLSFASVVFFLFSSSSFRPPFLFLLSFA